MILFKNMYKFSVLVLLGTSLVFSVNAKILSKEMAIPNDSDSLSLWLIARIGWVYCERAAEYMEESGEQFNEQKCKQCYELLYHDNIKKSDNVAESDILQCARNFGNPETPFPREPLRSNGVRAYLCNPEIRDTPTGVFGIRESFADPYRKFSAQNEVNQDYSRKSYIRCLMGKLYETEHNIYMSEISLQCALPQIEENVLKQESVKTKTRFSQHLYQYIIKNEAVKSK